MKKLFALVDCNNFYVSCERVFNPRLEGKPVVVLSNNDGCIIARSNEAKELGIPMGAPLFEWRSIIERNKVLVYSANFSLYGDFSDRVMSVLGQSVPDMEIYSIDEAFLLLENATDVSISARTIRAKVKQWTGIPVSIGIGRTKTLAKIGNVLAKKDKRLGGVFDVEHSPSQDAVLAQVPVEKVWGIGRRYTRFLNKMGIYNALQFKNRDDDWIKKHMTITGLRTAWELRGISCIPFEQEPALQKTMVVSRSFGEPITDKKRLGEAVAYFTMRVAQNLHELGAVAQFISVYITTSPFNSTNYYSNRGAQELIVPSSYAPTLLQATGTILNDIFKPGYRYKKAGVMAWGILYASERQLSIEQPIINESREDTVMNTLGLLNGRWGKDAVRFASLGVGNSLKLKQVHKSPRYTTSWHELPKVLT